MMNLSIEVLLVVAAQCAIAVLVAFAIQWFLSWLGCPDQPAKIIMAIVWIVVGVFVIVKLFRLAGVA